MKTTGSMRILHKLIGKAGFVPFFPPIFGRAHDFCVSLMDKKETDSDCSLPRFRTGETDEPHDDGMSELSDMESEWDPCETPGQLEDEFQDTDKNRAACVLTGSSNNGHFHLISAGFAESFGWLRQELIGKQVIRLLSPDLWTQYQLDCMYNQVFEQGGAQTLDVALRCKSGELKPCRVSMEKVATGFNSQPLDVLVMTSDELD